MTTDDEMTAEADAEVERIMAMSDEELVADAIAEYGSKQAVDVVVGFYRRMICETIERSHAIRAAEQAAAAREREACAKLAEQTDFDIDKFTDWNRQIAAAIRQRGVGEG